MRGGRAGQTVRMLRERAGPAAEDADPDLTLLAAVVDQSPLGLAVFDTALRFRLVNGCLARINGLPAQDHVGRRVHDVVPGMDAGVEGALRRVLETGEPQLDVRVRGRTRSDPGHDHVYEMAVYRIDGAGGKPLGVSAVVLDVTARQDALDAADVAASRLRLLNEAGTRIGSTLDLDRTAAELVELTVPRLADHAAVDLLVGVLPDGPALERPGRARVRRVARAGSSPRLTELLSVGETLEHPPGSPAATALERGRPVLADVDEILLRRSGAGSDEAATAVRAGQRAALVVPLVARGGALGVATLLRSGPGPGFTPADVALAEEVAARAALAMDNARLYTRERDTAVALQRSLLPHGRPDLERVTVARRYLPGSRATEVGGDWYDVVPLAGGRVALVVGDVMGRGVRAAAAMGQLRTAVRTLAVLDLMPEDVLAHLDDLAQSLDQVQLATCVYAVYDPVGRQLRYATAGHLPPVLCAPDRSPYLLDGASGAPLGVGGVPFESGVVDVADGTRVVLYTDGLVESRETDLDTGLDRLVAALGTAPRELEPLCDHVLSRLGRDVAHDDDVALLAARLEGVDPGRCVRWAVASDLAAVSRARRLTRERLRVWQLDPLVDTATLLVSELVTNAIRYARDPVELCLLLMGDRIEVAVGDSDTRLPRLRRSTPEDEGGRGLHLVGTLARRWGARSTATGKIVWFELAVP